MATSQRALHIKSTSILRRRPNLDEFPRNFHVLFRCNFFEISTSFPHAFFDVISMVEKSTLFSRTFFGVILLVKKSTLFPRSSFHVILMVEKSTLFARTFFEETLMGNNSTLLLVSCKLMKTFEEVFLCL